MKSFNELINEANNLLAEESYITKCQTKDGCRISIYKDPFLTQKPWTVREQKGSTDIKLSQFATEDEANKKYNELQKEHGGVYGYYAAPGKTELPPRTKR